MADTPDPPPNADPMCTVLYDGWAHVSDADQGHPKRADKSVQDGEDRYRLLFDAIAQGFCVVEVIFDDDQTPIDYRFLETNAAFERHAGLINMHGKRMRELAANHEEFWLEIYGKVAVTGQPARFVDHGEQLQSWHDVYAFRIGQPEDRQVGILFGDITAHKQAEEALRKSEASLREAQRLAHIGDWQWTVETDTVTWSEELYHIFGLDPELPPPCFAELSPCYTPGSWERLTAVVASSLHTGEPYELDLDIVRPDGTTRPTSTRADTDCDAGGRVVALHGTVQDMTERRRAEEELRESVRWLDESQRIAQLGHYIYDVQGDRWSGSPSLYEVLGVDESYARDLVGWLGLVHPEDRERLSRYFTEGVLGGRVPFDTLYRIVRPRDKTERLVHGLGTLEVGADGRVVSMFGIIQDITDSERAEKTLETSERRFRETADHAQEWFWEIDAEGRYTYSSIVVERILGYTPEEVLQKRFYDLFLPDDREALKAAALASFVTKQPFDEFINCKVHKNGSLVWISTSGLPSLDDGGNLLGYRGVDTDVTERRQAEKELEDQLAELQRWYDATLGRENRVIELKREVNALLRAAGHPPRYPSAEEEEMTGRRSI